MKVLFVCKSNVGRSQMAEAFFNKLSKKNIGSSAGISELFSGKKLENIAGKIIKWMKEEEINISEKFPKQLTKSIANNSDLVVWIAPEEKIPEYLLNKNIIFWNVKDAGGKTYKFHCFTKDKIKKLVKELVKKIG